jgi:hypothetical protein
LVCLAIVAAAIGIELQVGQALETRINQIAATQTETTLVPNVSISDIMAAATRWFAGPAGNISGIIPGNKLSAEPISLLTTRPWGFPKNSPKLIECAKAVAITILTSQDSILWIAQGFNNRPASPAFLGFKAAHPFVPGRFLPTCIRGQYEPPFVRWSTSHAVCPWNIDAMGL